MIAPSTSQASTSSGSAAGAAKPPAVANPTTKPNDRLGKDAFLKLLIAQLKYQDPLSPMDNSEFIAQTAQLTMTEKLEELAKSAETSTLDSNRRAASELIGKTISYDNGTTVVEGVVTSARMNGGNPILMLGRTEVPLGAVLEVRATVGASNSNS